MGVVGGRLATGAVGAIVGAIMLVAGASLLLGGPFFRTSQQTDPWYFGGGESSSAVLTAVGVLGVLLVLLGGYLFAVGLRGSMDSFH